MQRKANDEHKSSSLKDNQLNFKKVAIVDINSLLICTHDQPYNKELIDIFNLSGIQDIYLITSGRLDANFVRKIQSLIKFLQEKSLQIHGVISPGDLYFSDNEAEFGAAFKTASVLINDHYEVGLYTHRIKPGEDKVYQNAMMQKLNPKISMLSQFVKNISSKQYYIFDSEASLVKEFQRNIAVARNDNTIQAYYVEDHASINPYEKSQSYIEHYRNDLRSEWFKHTNNSIVKNKLIDINNDLTKLSSSTNVLENMHKKNKTALYDYFMMKSGCEKYFDHLSLQQKKHPTDKDVAVKLNVVKKMLDLLQANANKPKIALWNLQSYLTADIKAILSSRRDSGIETFGKVVATVVTLSLAHLIGGIWDVKGKTLSERIQRLNVSKPQVEPIESKRAAAR